MSNVFSNTLSDPIDTFTLNVGSVLALKFFSPKKDYQNNDSVSRLGNKGLFKPLLTANSIKGMVARVGKRDLQARNTGGSSSH